MKSTQVVWRSKWSWKWDQKKYWSLSLIVGRVREISIGSRAFHRQAILLKKIWQLMLVEVHWKISSELGPDVEGILEKVTWSKMLKPSSGNLRNWTKIIHQASWYMRGTCTFTCDQDQLVIKGLKSWSRDQGAFISHMYFHISLDH